jgi:hypothetical protein
MTFLTTGERVSSTCGWFSFNAPIDMAKPD